MATPGAQRSRLALSLVMSASLPLTALGADGFGTLPDIGLPIKNLPAGIAFIVQTALTLAAVIALGFLVYGGFKYITAEGDDAKIQEAKKTITGAVIGLAVLGLSLAIVIFVAGALGIRE